MTLWVCAPLGVRAYSGNNPGEDLVKIAQWDTIEADGDFVVEEDVKARIVRVPVAVLQPRLRKLLTKKRTWKRT